MEGSGDVEDAPRLQGGVSVAWRITRNASLTLDCLRGSCRRDLAKVPGDREPDKAHLVAGQLALEF